MKNKLLISITTILILTISGCFFQEKDKADDKPEKEILINQIKAYSEDQMKRGLPRQDGDVYVLVDPEVVTGFYLDMGDKIYHYDFQDFFALSENEELTFTERWSQAKPDTSFLVNSIGSVSTLTFLRSKESQFGTALEETTLSTNSAAFNTVINPDTEVINGRRNLKYYADGYGPKLTITPEATAILESSVEIEITSSVSEAAIKYTKDGTDPNINSTGYTTSFFIADDKTIKASANKDGWVPGKVYSKAYSLNTVANPQFSVAGGTYDERKTVEITTATEGSTIRYTKDGTDPNETVGKIYDETINISKTTTVKAIAYREDYKSSDIITAEYIITDEIAPTITDSAITVSDITESGAILSWDKATDNITQQEDIEYKIVKSDTNNLNDVSTLETNGDLVQDWTSDISTIALNDLPHSTTKYYNVIARDSTGNRSIYNQVEVTTPDKISPVPGNTGSITMVGEITSGELTIEWTEATDNKDNGSQLQYKIVISETNNISSVINANSNGVTKKDWATVTFNSNKAEYTIDGLEDNKRYFVNILVKDTSGNIGAYIPLNTLTDDTNAPTVGDGGRIDLTQVTETTVNISWTKATDGLTLRDNVEYKVVKSESDNISSVATATSNGTTVTDWTKDIGSTTDATGLSKYTTYYFNILVKDEAGNLAVYTADSIRTRDLTSPTVDAGDDIALTNSTVNLDSTSSDNESGIGSYLWEKVSGDGTVTFSAIDVEDPTFTGAEGVETTYTLKLTVTDNADNSADDTVNVEWDKKAPSITGGNLVFPN